MTTQRLSLRATGEKSDNAEVYQLLEGATVCGTVRRKRWMGTDSTRWCFVGSMPLCVEQMPVTWPTLPDCKAWMAVANGDAPTAEFMGVTMPLPQTVAVVGEALVHWAHDRKGVESVARVFVQQFGGRARIVRLNALGARVVNGFEGYGTRDGGDERSQFRIRRLAQCLSCDGNVDGCEECDGGAVALDGGEA